MKKSPVFILLFAIAIFTTKNVVAQTVVLSESFENYNAATLKPDNWIIIDKDGDGNNWHVGYQVNSTEGGALLPTDGVRMLASYSYSMKALTPDNWAISPKINVEKANLQFDVNPGNKTYPNEHYGVYISTTSTNTEDFTLLFEETLSATSRWTPCNWVHRNIDISAYSGDVYIAFRHFEVTNQNFICIDMVNVTNNAASALDNDANKENINVFPNPISDILNIVGLNVENVRIFNIEGKNIANYKNEKSISLANFDNGIYFLKIYTKNGNTRQEKFVISK